MDSVQSEGLETDQHYYQAAERQEADRRRKLLLDRCIFSTDILQLILIAGRDVRKYHETVDGSGQPLNTTVFPFVACTDSHFQLNSVPQLHLAPASSPSSKPLPAPDRSSNPQICIIAARGPQRSCRLPKSAPTLTQLALLTYQAAINPLCSYPRATHPELRAGLSKHPVRRVFKIIATHPNAVVTDIQDQGRRKSDCNRHPTNHERLVDDGCRSASFAASATGEEVV